tara:strand:+ start:5022 stop:5705 length:684 start_codon:yes stop_codon:yes gene_type:complete
MPVVPATIAASSFGAYTSIIPTAATAIRANPVMGIPPHNPAHMLISTCATVFATIAMSTPFVCNYIGVASPAGAVAAPVPFLFKAVGGAGVQLAGTMGWVGPSAIPFANALAQSPAQFVMTMGQMQCPPVPGGGVGAGTISSLNNSHLASTGPTVIYPALKSAIMSTQCFAIGDVLPPVGVAPQTDLLLVALANVYATILASIECAVAFAGATAPSPFTSVTTGKIL